MAYVDLDAHHGDGVEAAFQDDPRIALFSVHEAGRWPGTGQYSRSNGRIINVVAPRGCGDGLFVDIRQRLLQPWLARHAGDAVVVTVGADPLAGDPLSTMGLSNGVVLDTVEAAVAASRHAVVLGGGGYNPWTTARLWTALWGRLNGWRAPVPLPPAARRVLAALDSDLIDASDHNPAWLSCLDDADGRAPPTESQSV